LSRDVIIDQSSVTNQPNDRSDTTIGWENKTSTHLPAPHQLVTSEDHFHPLDSRTPSVSTPSPNTEMLEAITLRPDLVSQGRPSTRQSTLKAKPRPWAKGSLEPRRSQRITQPYLPGEPHGHYALFAGHEEEEPQTLTEALSGNLREEWKSAWESEPLFTSVTCVHVPVTVHRSGQCRISYV